MAGEHFQDKMWGSAVKKMMNSKDPRGIFAIGILRNTKRPMERLNKKYTRDNKINAEAEKTMHKVQKPMQKLKHK